MTPAEMRPFASAMVPAPVWPRDRAVIVVSKGASRPALGAGAGRRKPMRGDGPESGRVELADPGGILLQPAKDRPGPQVILGKTYSGDPAAVAGEGARALRLEEVPPYDRGYLLPTSDVRVGAAHVLGRPCHCRAIRY